MLTAVLKGAGKSVTRAAVDHVRYLGAIAKRRATAKVRRALNGARPPASTAEVGPGEANEAAARNYEPRPLHIPVVQIFAAGVETSTEVLDDPRFGWCDFATAGFTSITVPGDHSTMFDARHALRLAAELQPLLDKTQQGS